MDIFVRKAVPEDSAIIAELSGQLGYACSGTEMSKRIESLLNKEDHCVFVAGYKGKILGWIHGFYTERLETVPFVEIGGLVVNEAFRGYGIGKHLVENIKEWSRKKEVSHLRVRCNTKRKATHIFYNKMSFKQTKEQKIFEMEISK